MPRTTLTAGPWTPTAGLVWSVSAAVVAWTWTMASIGPIWSHAWTQQAAERHERLYIKTVTTTDSTHHV